MARESSGMRYLFIVPFCSLIIFGAAFAAPTDEGDKLVLAGERIGHARLKMDGAKLDKLFGKPTTSDAAMGHSSETWCSKSPDGQMQETDVYFIATDQDRKHWEVTKVVVTSPFFHTPAGITTQSEPAAIWREFPDLQYADAGKTKDGVSVELYDSVANGIGFVIERSAQPAPGKPWGKCRAIVVFPRGDEIGVPYLGDWEPK